MSKKPVGFWLEVADRRFARVEFPYQMATWSWSAGLSADLEAAEEEALKNERRALHKAEEAAQMRRDMTEIAANRSHRWFETQKAWEAEAEFWASVAADAVAVSFQGAA